jgi:hypothetical protein
MSNNTNTIIYFSDTVYNTSLLSSILLYRVSIEVPPGVVPNTNMLNPYSLKKIDGSGYKILIEAPTAIIAYMTAMELGYVVTHINNMYHD